MAVDGAGAPVVGYFSQGGPSVDGLTFAEWSSTAWSYATVTTSAEANTGDTVLISGTLSTDKDFGYGYAYDVIVEEAEVTVE